MTVTMTDEAMVEEAKAKEKGSDVEIVELRMYLQKGKIMWVEPIDPEELYKSKATGSQYTVDIVPDLRKEHIREVSPVAFQQESPGCSYWYVYETNNGIVKICLRP